MYLCPQIFAEFGAEEVQVAMLSTFTGLFYLDATSFGGRLGYYNYEYQVDVYDQRRALLAYCQNEKRWTLSLHATNNDKDQDDPCNWIAASEESTDFDVLATANSQWVVKTQTKGVLPLSKHFLACYDCTNDENFCGEHGKCSTFGQCTCTGGRYGTRCELVACPRLEVDPRNDGFPKAGGGYYASKLQILPTGGCTC